MADNFLKLNEDKTEVSFSSTRQQLNRCKDYIGNRVTIAGENEYPISVHNLGFYFDNNVKGSSHVNMLCSTACSILHSTSKIHHCFDTLSTKILIQALIR